MSMKKFERALDRATDQANLETDWDAVIEVIDMLRGKEIPAKPALAAVRKKIHSDNPHVALHGLHVLEAMVKNGGDRVHTELASREVMEDIKNLAFDNSPDSVKEKLLEMVQCWAMAFAKKPEYKLIVDTHNLMKLAGCEFPSVKESDAMFVSTVAPDWADGDECYRCRTAFGILTRKHHCRACGQIFCDRCSSKQAYLPQIGIEKLVRVCDACFEKTSSGVSTALSGGVSVTPVAQQKAKEEREAKEKALAEQKRLREQEEEELQLALAISQSEAEAKAKERERNRSMGQALLDQRNVVDNFAAMSVRGNSESPAPQTNGFGYKGAAPSVTDDAEDPLARYLNRDYWQARHDGATSSDLGGPIAPSAPVPSISLASSLAPSTPTLADPTEFPRQASLGGGGSGGGAQPPPVDEMLQSSAEVEDTMEFCRRIRAQVDTLSTRIRSNTLRGRSLINDPSIQQLFTQLTEKHGEVLARLNALDQERSRYEHIQDRVAHIHEAREAMDFLREEHAKREAERLAEEKRQRDAALQQQLAHVRTLKQEMLLQQRNTALQRFQQQEMEMQARRAMAMGYKQPAYGVQQGVVPPQMGAPLQNIPVTSATHQYNSHVQSTQTAPQGYPTPQQAPQAPATTNGYGHTPSPQQPVTGYTPQSYAGYGGYAAPQQPVPEQSAVNGMPQQGYPVPSGYQQQAVVPTASQQQQQQYHAQIQQPHYQQQPQQQFYSVPTPQPAYPQYQVPAQTQQQQPAPTPRVEEAALISFD